MSIYIFYPLPCFFLHTLGRFDWYIRGLHTLLLYLKDLLYTQCTGLSDRMTTCANSFRFYGSFLPSGVCQIVAPGVLFQHLLEWQSQQFDDWFCGLCLSSTVVLYCSIS